MSEYKSTPPVRHIDLYRLGDAPLSEEDLQMFLETIETFPGWVLLEWADLGFDWLPLQIPLLRVEFGGENQRKLKLDTFRPEEFDLHEVF